MPQSKQLLTNSRKSGKKKSTVPESENEFLAGDKIFSELLKADEGAKIEFPAGVELEEAGEKWLAGDAAKSSRFFTKALENYEAGLARFPRSFDLAYNRARLQYDLAQQPRLLAHLPSTLTNLLRLALESHRYAIDINQDNPDLLFNTAQVLTSLVETSTERGHAAGSQINTLRFLQEALELFQRCLTLQEYLLSQNGTRPSSTGPDREGYDADERSSKDDIHNGAKSEETWVSVEEPVTKDSLLDTLITQLETLTTACGLPTSQGSTNLGWIEEYYRVLKDKMALLAHDTERAREAALANAKFMAAFADASFRYGQLDMLEYEREQNAAFNKSLDLSNDPQGLCDRADAEHMFSASIFASVQVINQLAGPDLAQLNELRWKHITRALDDLTTASKIPNAEHLPRIHLRRGDCELLRYQLGREPDSHPIAAKSAATLIKNAEVYYRGAAALARNAGKEEEAQEGLIKEAVVASIAGSNSKLQEFSRTDEKAVTEIVEDMREEGLLLGNDIQGIQ